MQMPHFKSSSTAARTARMGLAPGLLSFFLAAAVAASTSYWVLRQGSNGAAGGQRVSMGETETTTDTQSLLRALGGGQPKAVVATASAPRLQLLGVVAGPQAAGHALIAMDGQAPKPYSIGDLVTDTWVLQAVHARSAQLGASRNGPAAVTLELPALNGQDTNSTPANRGVTPPGLPAPVPMRPAAPGAELQ